MNKLTLTSIAALSLMSSGRCDLDAANVRWGGFLSTGYLESSRYNYLGNTEDGTTSFSEVGLNASWTPVERLTVNGQAFAFELGPYGNFDPLVDYLFLDYNLNRSFGVRFGRIKRELGMYMHVQDIDLSRPTILLPMSLYDQRYRDFSASLDGVGIYGNVDLWEGAYLDYTLYGGWVDLKPDGAIAGIASIEASKISEVFHLEYLDSEYNYGAQFWLSPAVDGLRIGLGSTVFPDISTAIINELPIYFPIPYLAGQSLRTEVRDFDLTLSYLSLDYFVGEWNFVAECSRMEMDYSVTSTALGMPISASQEEMTSLAWYLSASRRFGRWEGALTYAEVYGDADNRSGTGLAEPSSAYNKDTQVSLRFDATDYWTLKVELHSINGTNRLFNEIGQNPVLDEEHWTLFAAKSTFFF